MMDFKKTSTKKEYTMVQINLKRFRAEQKLSQEAMARKIGVTVSFYEKIENGRAGFSAGFLVKFKKAFPEASIDKIFFA